MPNIVIEWNGVYLNAIRNKKQDSPGGIARKRRNAARRDL